MKKTIVCATAAFLCCGASSSFAQMQMLSGQPTPAPRLAAAQIVEAEIANPFGELESTNDPTSLNVRRVEERDVVDALVDYSTLTNTPDCSVVAVDWNHHARTPNPVADILLRQRCADGLWDGYPAQRAAECARMYEKLNGHCGCGSCGVAGPCNACAPAAICDSKPRNRYLEGLQHHLFGKSKDACDVTTTVVAPKSCDAPACDDDKCASLNATEASTQSAFAAPNPITDIREKVVSWLK